MLKTFANSVVRDLRERGHQAYLVGGCVRDLLLGYVPTDYDVATSATPEEVMRIFPRTYAIGAQFGVVMVAQPDGSDASRPSAESAQTVEVATFRCDMGYSDGRHPDAVRFSLNPREDVARRDFTINGLLLDPETDQVLDFVDGQADLRIGVVRTIGDPRKRFAEDKLRLLRAVRFAARFGFGIDADTFAAIREMAGEIHGVSRERIRDELTKMLTEGKARRAFELLDESGLLRELLPEIAAMQGVEQPPQFHPEGDVWIHTLMLLENLAGGAAKTLAWGALLHDVGKPATFRRAPDRIRFDRHVEVGAKMAEEICRRLRFSTDETTQIVALVENHMRFGDVQRMKASTLKRFLRLPRLEEHMELHRLDCAASHREFGNYEYVRRQLAATPPQEIQPAPLLTGSDLIAIGYPPGPLFKEILTAVEDAQLEGALSTPEAALELVRRRFPLDESHPALPRVGC